jgi:hypothetical protein
MYRYSWPHIPLAGQSWLQLPTVGLWLPKAPRRLDCWLQAWLDGGSDDITAFLRSPAVVNRNSLTHNRLSVVARENWRAEARGSVLMCMATFTGAEARGSVLMCMATFTAYGGQHVGKATAASMSCCMESKGRGWLLAASHKVVHSPCCLLPSLPLKNVVRDTEPGGDAHTQISVTCRCFGQREVGATNIHG